ncbi:isoleucine--tRNA ligase [Geomicrobium sediminis]|uniref:Isoleucine--tRNA ligase n=1 Tax=Geomicrobium sediminis TaxID=1347788 RepID=A0ABS2PAS1_9BACL|nr:isoleucine--tRNA ligase [Geomicrobium sediminis]MBM7632512.1 isoleucyl-tRNA synthetase [Geomicrobium sediminis]
MNFKKTLRMPQTEFPMRGNLPNREPVWQGEWEEAKLYEQVMTKNADKPMYVLHDGPIYANGNIHVGHAMNRIVKDMIVRHRNMDGFKAPFVPGWDAHGLPIETALTKTKKVDRKKMSVSEFRAACEAYAWDQVETQKEQFKRLGMIGDFDNPYVTLTPDFEANQIKVFGEMAKAGHVYQGKKPVYWSPSSESALAEAEIEYHDKRSPSIYVAMKVTDGKGVIDNGSEFIIWTTTPWTLPANLGISVHPDYDYALVSVADRTFVIASKLFDEVSETLEWEDAKIVKTVKGAELDQVVAAHPFYDRDSLVMTGQHVTLDAGTGAVHTAPGHGEDDFIIGQQYGLEPLCPVDNKGVMTEEAPGFAGIFYDEANKPITEKLDENGALLKLKFITHSYPHDWRTKKPVIYRATEQWFVSVENMRQELLDAIARVDWQPKWGEVRLHNMIRDRGDWCISRQRVWGVPIPVFYEEDGSPIITDETIAHVADLFREHGSNIWFDWETKDLMPNGYSSEKSPNGNYTRETDIMDVWFDSGSSHQGVLEERDDQHRPADLYFEGSDQYRGWFNSSLITSVAVTGDAPYKKVLSHGFTLDGKGEKMSKSLGNVIDPAKVMKQLGADILRLWVSSTDFQSDVRVSDDILKQVSETYRKIRNTLRFMLGNLSDFDPATDRVKMSDMNDVDLFMYQRLNDVISRAQKGYREYAFGTTYQALHHFCSIDLSAFYMDVAKDALYCDHENDAERRAMQTVLYDSVVALTKLLAPITPYTAEEAWCFIKDRETDYVQLTEMPDVFTIDNESEREARWAHLLNVRTVVLKALEEARADKVIGKSLEAKLVLTVDETAYAMLNEMSHPEKLFIVSQLELVKGEETNVSVQKAEGEACERCWHVKEDVGEDESFNTLCTRCADVVKTYDPAILEETAK